MGEGKRLHEAQGDDGTAFLEGPGMQALELSHDAGALLDQAHSRADNLGYINGQRQDSDTVKLLGNEEDQEGTELLHDPQYMRRVLASSMIGNLLEWYVHFSPPAPVMCVCCSLGNRAPLCIRTSETWCSCTAGMTSCCTA
jgi:hypothetical protein